MTICVQFLMMAQQCVGETTSTDNLVMEQLLTQTPVAVNLPAGRTATALALGWQHSCAILDDGSTIVGDTTPMDN